MTVYIFKLLTINNQNRRNSFIFKCQLSLTDHTCFYSDLYVPAQYLQHVYLASVYITMCDQWMGGY